METITELMPPGRGEYDVFYQKYIDLVPKGDLVSLYQKQEQFIRFFFSQLNEKQAILSYGPDKWSFKQLLGHLIDTENIMHFRALCMSREEGISLPGFDQDAYVHHAEFNQVPLQNLIESYQYNRKSLVAFITAVSEKSWRKMGEIDGKPMSVRALIYIIPGHLEHHKRILESNYSPLIK